jgi:hypothetical protein
MNHTKIQSQNLVIFMFYPMEISNTLHLQVLLIINVHYEKQMMQVEKMHGGNKNL